MSVLLAAETPPLHADETGTIRVGGTRVPLDHVLALHRTGLTPEQIVERCDTLAVADVYAAIGFALRHRVEVETYLNRRAAEAAQLQERILATQPPFPTRAELLARRGTGP